MRVTSIVSAVSAIVLCLAAAGASAQALPTDNGQWGARCAMMVSNGGVPAADPSGIAPNRWEELARERSSRGQHLVACNLFFAAAAGFAGQGNAQESQLDISSAKMEQKLGMHVKLSFMDKLTRSSEMLNTVSSQSLPPNPQEISAMSMMVGPPGPGGFAPPPGPAPNGGMPGQYAGGPAPGQYAPAPAPPGQYPQPGAPAPPQGQYGGPPGQFPAPPPAAPQPYNNFSGGQPGYAPPPSQTSYPPPQPQYPAAQTQYPAPPPNAAPAAPAAYGAPAPAGPQAPSIQDDAGAPPKPGISTTGPLNRQLIEQVIYDSLYPGAGNSGTATSLDFHSVQIAKGRVAHAEQGIADGTTFYPVLVKFTSSTRVQSDPNFPPQYTVHDMVQVYDFFRDDFGNWSLKTVASSENRDVQSQHN